MFGIGWTEFLVIALVLLIVVGPRQLPAMFRKAGQVIGELKSASRDLRHQVTSEVREIEEDLREVASPKELPDDVKGDPDIDVGSPYDAIRRGRAAVRRGESSIRKEIQSIKDSIERDEDEAAEDISTGSTGKVAPLAGDDAGGKKT